MVVKGNLGVAVEVLKDLERADIPIVALAKARSQFSRKDFQKKLAASKDKTQQQGQGTQKDGNRKKESLLKDQDATHSEERFFLPGRKNPIIFKPQSQPFQILVSLRDEAHRFAITHHRKLREKKHIAQSIRRHSRTWQTKRS